ncbi:hypothetical protein FACS189419_06040 [Planctomycetales bacterium]|nr:hypothetical protein FACS189419_06040 [Planctomycetales bacterium]
MSGNVLLTADYLRSWLPEMKRLLRPTGSIYVCGDWRSAAAIQTVLEENVIRLARFIYLPPQERDMQRSEISR